MITDLTDLLQKFDEAVATVRLHDGPRPGGKSEDWLKGQDTGIRQGLKIARSLLETIADTEERSAPHHGEPV